MQALHFPEYQFRFKSNENKTYIFDILRKKYVVLSPEEWVRQHVVCYLLEEKKYPKSMIAVEKQFTINRLKKRFDILVYNSQGNPLLIVECKAPSVKITQEIFDQIAQYNMQLNAELLMVSNGLDHYFCNLDHKNQRYNFLKDLPPYSKP
ncbi:MAG: type I restriction enzyme HsdR N-terminal domain-containing protein [Flavobacteriaceae bacterium]|nr:type I restriction enzyme HsdR N-terminal domain-containing protein [Flavobacteriaceae bacterium]